MTPETQKQTSRRLRVGFVVFDGMTLLDITGPSEVFRYARSLGLDIEMPLIAPRPGEVQTTSGLSLTGAVTPADAGPLDLVIVSGGDLLAEHVPSELLETARDATARSREIASVCTGAFVLAELGLLDGRRATTHWRHAAALARKHPSVRVSPDAIFVRDGHCLTSAGVTAGIDLALAVIESELGAEASLEIARELVVFLQRPGGQSQFSAGLESSVPRDSLLHSVTSSVTADPAAQHTVESMAQRAAVSPRHLSRLFQDELGMTPHRWLQRVRLSTATAHLLAGAGVLDAAHRSGLGSDDTLRRLLMREHGLTPKEYIRRFSTTHPR